MLHRAINNLPVFLKQMFHFNANVFSNFFCNRSHFALTVCTVTRISDTAADFPTPSRVFLSLRRSSLSWRLLPLAFPSFFPLKLIMKEIGQSEPKAIR